MVKSRREKGARMMKKRCSAINAFLLIFFFTQSTTKYYGSEFNSKKIKKNLEKSLRTSVAIVKLFRMRRDDDGKFQFM